MITLHWLIVRSVEILAGVVLIFLATHVIGTYGPAWIKKPVSHLHAGAIVTMILFFYIIVGLLLVDLWYIFRA